MTGSSPEGHPATEKTPWLKVLGIVCGLSLAVPLMVLAFLSPMINSGPEELPLGISGPAAITDRFEAQLDQAQPGAFAVSDYDSPEAVTEAVLDREVIGGISVDDAGAVIVTTAGGAGTPYGPLLQNLGDAFAEQGMIVDYDDIAPLTQDDPNGMGLSALGLPLAFGGMISAVLLSTLLKKRPWHRIAGSLLASLAVGFVVVAILQFGFGAFDGSYVLTSLALALGTAAISLFVLGLESVLGFPGLGIGGLLMMFVATPLSGMATGWQWLPAPWGFIGQLMPIGSAGTLIRSAAFFDGHGAAFPVLVLAGWCVVGLVLAGTAAFRKRPAHATGA